MNDDKSALGVIVVVLTGILSFIGSGVATFFALIFLDNSHDGQAGLAYFVWALLAGACCGVGAAIFLGRYFWRRYSRRDPGVT